MTKPNKATIETLKTIALVGVIAIVSGFVGGMKYQGHVNNQVKAEAKSIVSLKS